MLKSCSEASQGVSVQELAQYRTVTSTACETMQTDKEITQQKIYPKLIPEEGNSVQLWRRRRLTAYVPVVYVLASKLSISPPQLTSLYTQCDTELQRMDSRTWGVYVQFFFLHRLFCIYTPRLVSFLVNTKYFRICFFFSFSCYP